MPNEIFEKLKAFSYMSIRDDLKYLQDKGIWKDGRIPAWAEVLREAYRCSGGAAVLMQTGWEFVAEAAIAELDLLKAGGQAPEAIPAKKKPVKPTKDEMTLMMSEVPGNRADAVRQFRARTGVPLKEAQKILLEATKKAV